MNSAKKKNNVAIDLGYGFTKVARYVTIDDKQELVKKIYPSVVKMKGKNVLSDTMGCTNDYVVNVNGSTYYIGEAALIQGGTRVWGSQNNFNPSYILTQIGTSLHIVSNKPSESVDLILGLPISVFLKKGNLDQIASIVKGKDIEVVIKDEKKSFTIASVVVYPQGVGALAKAIDDRLVSTDERTGVIDIGYRTIDFSVSEENDLVDELSDSLPERGMGYVYENIASKLNSINGKNFVDYKVEKRINRNDDLPEDIAKALNAKTFRDIAEPIFEAHAAAIISEIKHKWGDNLESLDRILITGGGGVTLFPYIKKLLPNAELQVDAQYANCEGYLVL